MPYPMQCAICGVIWNRQDYERLEPPPNPPHNHTEVDWQRFFTDHSLDPASARRWLRLDTETYPTLPTWPPELGPDPGVQPPQQPRPPTTGYATG